jgi:hypothetical protein
VLTLLGDIRFVDVNNDGVINSSDRTNIEINTNGNNGIQFANEL